MNPSEQRIDVTDSTPVSCEVCGWVAPRWMQMTFRTGKFVMGGNMWGIPDGTFCGMCVIQRESLMKEQGIFTGKIVDEIPWSDFELPRPSVFFEENGRWVWKGLEKESFAGTKAIAEAMRKRWKEEDEKRKK